MDLGPVEVQLRPLEPTPEGGLERIDGLARQVEGQGAAGQLEIDPGVAERPGAHGGAVLVQSLGVPPTPGQNQSADKMVEAGIPGVGAPGTVGRDRVREPGGQDGVLRGHRRGGGQGKIPGNLAASVRGCATGVRQRAGRAEEEVRRQERALGFEIEDGHEERIDGRVGPPDGPERRAALSHQGGGRPEPSHHPQRDGAEPSIAAPRIADRQVEHHRTAPLHPGDVVLIDGSGEETGDRIDRPAVELGVPGPRFPGEIVAAEPEIVGGGRGRRLGVLGQQGGPSVERCDHGRDGVDPIVGQKERRETLTEPTGTGSATAGGGVDGDGSIEESDGAFHRRPAHREDLGRATEGFRIAGVPNGQRFSGRNAAGLALIAADMGPDQEAVMGGGPIGELLGQPSHSIGRRIAHQGRAPPTVVGGHREG